MTIHVPSRPTVVSTKSRSLTLTLIFESARPVPLKVLSVDETISLIVGVTIGTVGLTLTCTLIVLEGFACVAAGCESVPD